MSSVMIHQPEYLPWTGLFHKMAVADTFVFLDTVQYLRRSYQNRNKIQNYQGEMWLTVPLKKSPREQTIQAMGIDNSKDWRQSHLSTFQTAYKKARYYKEVMDLIKPVYEKQWESLCDLNCYITQTIARALNLKTTFLKASEMKALGEKSARILNICLELKATCYISGIGAKSYLDESSFSENSIEIIYVPPIPIEYTQCHSANSFVDGLSIIDFLFNCGFEYVSEKLQQDIHQYKFNKKDR